jgi:hypothetical protein
MSFTFDRMFLRLRRRSPFHPPYSSSVNLASGHEGLTVNLGALVPHNRFGRWNRSGNSRVFQSGIRSPLGLFVGLPGAL